MGRRQFGKQIAVFCCRPQLVLVHFLHFLSGQQTGGFNVHLAADFPCHSFAVPCQDHRTDPMIPKCLNSSPGTFLRRIKKADKADQYQILFIFYTERTAVRHLIFLCNGNHPQPFRIVPPVGFQRDLPRFPVHWQHTPVDLYERGDSNDFLHSPFGNQLTLSFLILQYHTHSAAGKVKGDFVHTLIVFQDWFQIRLLCPFDDGQINEIFEPGLKITVQIGMTQDSWVRFPMKIHIFFHNDFVLSQGTCLIRAEYVHFPECLYGTEGPYNDLVPGHGDCSAGQR